jgi:23S rRNA G2069 N7-methylase RlmK/C1962 C5-methylase RlmI
MSNTYLDFAKANMTLNGHTESKHKFIRDDIVHILKEGGVNRRYDLIVLDPPTVSRSKTMKTAFNIKKDSTWLINAALNLLNPGGLLYFSTNFKKFKLNTAKINCSSIQNITAATTPPDFAGRLPHHCFKLKKNET